MSNQPDETNPEPLPTPPWWRKKRWILAGLLWVGFTYLLSTGPANYAEGRGWLSSSTVRAYCRPAFSLSMRLPPLAELYFPYARWWGLRGKDRFVHHEASTHQAGWDIAVSWTEPANSEPRAPYAEAKFWTGGRGRYTRHFVDGHSVVIDNGRKQPDGSWKWDGPILLDGKTVAELPAGTRKVAIEYIDGELAVEADGVEVDVDQ